MCSSDLYIGWEKIDNIGLKSLPKKSYFYFNHSYGTQSSGDGSPHWVSEKGFIVFENVGRTYGTQFHPEKSQNTGLRFLNWLFTENEMRYK